MVGLNQEQDGLHYFYAWLLFLVTSFASGNYIRMCSTMVRDLSTAQALAPGTLIIFIVFCGFIINGQNLGWWFRWVHYISPFKYSFEALMINEFHSGVYPLAANTSMLVKGDVYLKQRFGITYSDQDSFKWGVLALLFAYGVVFVFLAIYFLNNLNFGQVAHTVTFKPKRRLRPRIAPKKKSKHGTLIMTAETPADIVSPAYLAWKNLSYEVVIPTGHNKPKKRKQLLVDVNGYVKPGMMVALMGSSGAGKSTLLDVLAQRKTGGFITGSVTLNGVETDQNFASIVGYVEQFPGR